MFLHRQEQNKQTFLPWLFMYFFFWRKFCSFIFASFIFNFSIQVFGKGLGKRVRHTKIQIHQDCAPCLDKKNDKSDRGSCKEKKSNEHMANAAV